MSLQNIQSEFADLLLSNDVITTDWFRPQQNMRIYRNNVTTTLVNTLLNTYPLVMRLVGEDFFRITAKEYIKHYPSCSSNLHAYGQYFSDFLATYPPVKSLTYLAEIADFEWRCHLLQFAADHTFFDIKRLEMITPEQYDHLHFMLHPASHIMQFHYPLLRIIDLCKGETDETIDITAGGIHLLIIRRDYEIKLAPLTKAEYTFLTSLEEGLCLSDALNVTLAIDPDFKLDEKLPAWIQDKTIVDVYLNR